MKNNKLIGIILALLVCLSVIVSASATTESDVIVTVGSADPTATNEAVGAIVAAPEATIQVAITLEENAGLYCFMPTIKYDATALEFVSATSQVIDVSVKNIDGGKRLTIGNLTEATMAYMNNGAANTFVGNIVVLEFKVLATDVDKTTDIDMTIGEVDFMVKNVNVAAQTSSVQVNITSASHECTETITTNDKAPTCTEVGATGDVHCAFCGTLISASEEIPALGHKYDLEAEGEVVKAPDCLNTGVKVYYCLNDDCNEPFEVEMEIAHEAIVPVPAKEATCFEEGNTEGTKCEKCGKTLTGEIIEKLPHTYDEGVQTKDPTCTDAGVLTFTCTAEGCGHSYTEVINPTGHTYVAIEEKLPTCELSGHTAGSRCACGMYEKEPEVIEALQHELKVNTTDAACGVEGLKVTYCDRCDYKTEEVLDALKHDYRIEVTYATCEAEGYTTYTCELCDDQYTDDVKEATGHTYGEYKVVTPASRTLPGVKEATCFNCNAVKSSRIDPLGGVNPLIIVIIVVVVLTGVAVGVYFVLKSKKKQTGKN